MQSRMFNYAYFSSIALIVTFFLFAYMYVVPAEDAAIVYDHAQTLSTKGLISYGGSLTPTEGATDFLWMILLSFFSKSGFDLFTIALIINLISSLLYISFFNKKIETLIVALAMIVTPFMYASLAGFGTAFFSTWYVFSIYLLLNKSRFVFLSVLILCLIRPDGVVFGTGIVILNLLQTYKKGELVERLRVCLIHLLVPGLMYFLWRFWYFGELFPLPFYVKTSTSADKFFLFYTTSIPVVLKMLIPALIPLIKSVVSKKSHNQNHAYYLAIISLPLLFYVMIRLEQNIGNRFMAPIFFALLLLVSRFYGTKALLLLLTFIVPLHAVTTLRTFNSIFSSTNENITYIAKELKHLKGKMLVTEAGRLAYYNDWHVHDSWGLNTPKFSRTLISETDIKKGDYDLVVGHCSLSYLRKDIKLTHDGSKTWDNMCKNIVKTVKKEDFSILLVPYYTNAPNVLQSLKNLKRGDAWSEKNSPCIRHDIYAISNHYLKKTRLIAILKKHGAIQFDRKLKIKNADKICLAH